MRAARRCCADGGVLCVVTPDPASRTARLAGARWWGYLPAHTYLLPRADAARGCCARRGLELVDDVGAAADVLAGLLVGGLGERSGRLGAGARAPARARRSGARR